MEESRKIQRCIEIMGELTETGTLKRPVDRLNFAHGFLDGVPEIEGLLAAIIGKENSPVALVGNGAKK